MKKIVSLLALSLILVSCGGVKVAYDYDEQADFSTLKTYNYIPDMQSGLSQLDLNRLMNATDAILQEQGYALSDNPDFLINVMSDRYEERANNNVGIGMPRNSVVDADMDEWDKVQETNVRSMVLTSRYAIPEMEKSSGSGSIINVSSIAALRPRGMTAYSTSKGAVIALTQAMAVDHAEQGIRVNCIVPGPVYTPMVYSRGMEPSLRERRKNASLLGIEGNGWDIGTAAVFLASDESRYITGVILPVDGGVHIKGPDR